MFASVTNPLHVISSIFLDGALLHYKPVSLSPFAYISVIIVIVGVAMLVSWINGKRIRRLEPVKMITEE